MRRRRRRRREGREEEEEEEEKEEKKKKKKKKKREACTPQNQFAVRSKFPGDSSENVVHACVVFIAATEAAPDFPWEPILFSFFFGVTSVVLIGLDSYGCLEKWRRIARKLREENVTRSSNV
ncbi:hypothetical protein V1477_004888 [Vespula maculifrons]|uniref:Uncharacterized protein n=1 Tax=Vespula maculifrons TaxID=7453 RepID=A0ABD2CN34_VESMC